MKQRKVVSMVGMVVALIGMVCMTIGCSDMAAPNNSSNDSNKPEPKIVEKTVDMLDLTAKFSFPKAGAYAGLYDGVVWSPVKGQYHIGYSMLNSNSGQAFESGYKFKAGDKITYKLTLSARTVNEGNVTTQYSFKGVGENTFTHDFADSITNPEGKGDTLQVTIKHTVK